MSSILNRIKLLEQEADSLNKVGSKKLLIPRGIESRNKQHIRIINKKIQQYIANGSLGDLDLLKSPIVNLPDNLKEVEGHLILARCRLLKSLPDNLQVGDDLYLTECDSLESLPNNLKVGGNAYMRGMTNLIHLPDNFEVRLGLYLGNCKSLNSLPNNLKVGGNLYLENTPIAKKYPTERIIIDYLKSINAKVRGMIYLK